MFQRIYKAIHQTDHLVSFIWRRLTSENLSFIAGGIAFYMILSFIPAISALVSLYGLLASPQDIVQLTQMVEPLLPPDLFETVLGQLQTLISHEDHTLGLTFFISFMLSLMTATRGVKAMMAGLNLVYGIAETRSWWRKNLIAYAFTLGSLLLMVISIAVIVLVPIALNILPVPDFLLPKIAYVRWGLFASIILVSFVGLYWTAPSIRIPWSWHLMIGAVIGGALWLLFSFGFSLFVHFFPSFNKVYGSYGAIIVVMMWSLLSSYAILLGGALHAGMMGHAFGHSQSQSQR